MMNVAAYDECDAVGGSSKYTNVFIRVVGVLYAH